MTKDEALKIFNRVKENNAKLHQCKGPHIFVPYTEDVSALRAFRKKRCIKCSGTLNDLDVLWYERGLKHGREESK